ncbi:actin-binding protein putative [Entamoeba histolytica]|uniref:Coronin n=3 Tax=Entamoeba histolytica TaxID=5759 RepID=C4M5M6_ENTH1|nr:actin-binding protein, putative [Entamoeba histolytica HM-1:IMSS]EAL48838.1 actin-binding protein, putative [Entamoeba histolytica HM-1:IMSS]ENY63552.1 actin-binding family protein, putative [Entamoeba histolytica HM-1:IMSS-A]GAT96733.1 actin-binding protein putative [Entamoeba histolytica]|eukprot:XP_654224.1 actin-binding protein, putative [Entamoeba histolytica HM-1:IMSS]
MSVSRRTLSLSANAKAVSGSKFKNIYGETWNVNTWIRNVHPNIGNEPIIQVSSKFYGIPWKSNGDGLMYVGIMNKAERISDKPYLIKAHNQQITTFEFSPFHERMLCTGSRDCSIKIWDIMPDGLTNDMSEAKVNIQEEKRITNVTFHPYADNLLASSCMDGTVKVYDITEPNEEVIKVNNGAAEVLTLNWEGCYGENFMTISKDFMYRLYDPRVSSEAITSYGVAETVKGLKGVFIEGSDYIVVSGFSKKGERTISLFDQRKQGIISKSIIDNQPSPLSIYYDNNNNLIYLTGRGNQIFTYEVQGTNLVNLGKTNIQEGIFGSAFVPQRLYDVKKCEIGRFVLLNSKCDTLYNVSFSLPRKEGKTIYQEDLYENVFSGVPEYTAREWLIPQTQEDNTKKRRSSQQGGSKRNSRRRSSVSLKPEHMKSIYEIGIEEGGKSKIQEKLEKYNLTQGKKMKKLKLSGGIEEIERGWIWNSYIKRWCEMNEKYVMIFNNRDDPVPAIIINILKITGFNRTEEIEGKVGIVIEIDEESEEVIKGKLKKKYVYFVNSQKEAEEWQTTFEILQENAEEIEEEKQEKQETKEVKEEEKTQREIEGLLYCIKPTMFSTIKHRYFYIEKGILYSQNITWWTEEATGNSEMECFLNRVIHLSKTEGIFPKSYGKNTFQLTSKGNVIHLACKNEEELEKWMNACTPNNLKGEEADEELEDFRRTPAQDEMEYYFKGIFGGYSKIIFTLVANEIFIFKNRTDSTPILKIYLKDIENIDINEDKGEMSIEMKEKGNKHEFKTEECKAWKEEIMERKKRTRDIMNELGIRGNILTNDNEINEEYIQEQSNLGEEYFTDFKKLIEGEPTLLIQIKGRRRLRSYVIELKQKELNPWNSYVLLCKEGIYVWRGQYSPKVNRSKAEELARRISEKERDKCKVILLTHGKDDRETDMWKKIGCQPTKFNPDNKEEKEGNNKSTEEQDKEEPEIIRIYRIVHNEKNEKNPLSVRMIYEHGNTTLPPKEILKEGTVNIISTSTEIYVWQSVTSTINCRKIGNIIGNELRKRNKPIIMVKINQNGENILFKEKFSNYPGTLPIQMGGIENKKMTKEVEHKPQKKIETMILEMKEKKISNFTEIILNVNGKMIFNNLKEGTYIIKRIEEHNTVEYPKELYGHFFSKEAFLIQYTFYPEGSEKAQHILYFWQGRDASLMDMGTLAHKVVETSGTVETSVQVRVVQGKEPKEFLKIFKGKFIVHLGGYSEYYDKRPEIYEIRGREEYLCKAVQMPISYQLEEKGKGMKLMPGSIYVFKTIKGIEVIEGKDSNEEEKKMVKMMEQEFKLPLSYNQEICKKIIGGNIEFIEGVEKSKENYHQIRLFKFTFWVTSVDIEEIEQPSQNDFNKEEVFLVDAGKLWLWFGSKAINETKRFSLQFALKCAEERGLKEVKIEQENEESMEFRALFEAWSDTNLLRKNNLRQNYPVCQKKEIELITQVIDGTFNEIDPALKNEISVEGKRVRSIKNPSEAIEIDGIEVDQSIIFPRIEKRSKVTEMDAKEMFDEYCRTRYTYAELITKPRPFGVDKSILETYLSDEEFQEVFGVSREEFYKMKPWCRDKLKHSVYLY